jgi:hypothetical protein
MSQVQAPARWLVVLWDVDHTLIENNGVNKETYAKAFELLTGRRAEHRAETDGRTEPEIMRNMLVAHGIEPTDDYLGRVVEVLEAARRPTLPVCVIVVTSCLARVMRWRRFKGCRASSSRFSAGTPGPMRT